MLAAPSSTFVAACSLLLAVASGAPLKATRSLVPRASYQVFSGDGSAGQGWPDVGNWLDFESLWQANLPLLSISCAQFGAAENSESEKAAIKEGLHLAAVKSGVDQRFLLAVMMQESKGCVRVTTTRSYEGIRNPGLMQDFNGKASCNEGAPQNPCPDDTIHQMIAEGAGIGMQVGLSIGIAASGASDVSKYFKAARIYNSGSIDGSGNLGLGGATHCYASDIANRLLGWVDSARTCNENSIGSLTGSAPMGNPPPTTTTPPPASSPAPGDNNGEAGTPDEPTTVTPAQRYAGAASNCKSYHEVKAGETCQSTGIDIATLLSLNNGLNANCDNLWLGYSYCVGI